MPVELISESNKSPRILTFNDFIKKIQFCIEMANNKIFINMTKPKIEYDWVCIKKNISYDYYFENLKINWERVVQEYVSQTNNSCQFRELMKIYKKYDPQTTNIENIIDLVFSENINFLDWDLDFKLDTNIFNNISNMCNIIYHSCQISDVYKCIIGKYKSKYKDKFKNKNKDDMITIIKTDFIQINDLIKNFTENSCFKENFFNDLSKNLQDMYNLSIRSELNTNLPDDLGMMKNFFTKIIEKYYDNLHPIIWAQILYSIFDNVFIQLPYTNKEIFQFISGNILKNSGPFILKIIQFIKPMLNADQIQKYSLKNMTYPKLNEKQVDYLLEKIMHNYDIYNIIDNYSASVGHICKLQKLSNPDENIIIKIIKPLSVIQSCWEYKTLINIFPKYSCEHKFIKSLLESNGKEFNVFNEINNINRAHQHYTCSYKSIFNLDVEANLTTIKYLPNILKDNYWFAFPMTLAPGIPLDKLLGQNIILNDTSYRANLHRCLDLLVYKFIYNIIKNGFYHGDLHSGNIFYSHELSQLTLIDFGCVNEFDIHSSDSSIQTILDILIMSIFYNYDGILDILTKFINNRCDNNKIDTNSKSYNIFKEQLEFYKNQNIINRNEIQKKYTIHNDQIFGKQRIIEENLSGQPIKFNIDINKNKSIYKYLDLEENINDSYIYENLEIFNNPISKKNNSEVCLNDILEKITKFYLSNGINIAIRFTEFYEFQRSYLLLVNVLKNFGYDDIRMSSVINKAIINWKNIPELLHLATTIRVTKIYLREKKLYNNLINNNTKLVQSCGYYDSLFKSQAQKKYSYDKF
ncbi:protein kinase [Moumouvirus maliensis]|nr:protein kinase [Moumouvirus maliensis]